MIGAKMPSKKDLEIVKMTRERLKYELEQARLDEQEKCNRQLDCAVKQAIRDTKKRTCLECQKNVAIFCDKCNGDDIQLARKHAQKDLFEKLTSREIIVKMLKKLERVILLP